MHGHDRHNTKYEIASSLSSDKDRTHWHQHQPGIHILAPLNKTPLTIDVHLTIQHGTKSFPILTTSLPWPVAETQATYDVYTATKADRCQTQLHLLLAAITTPQYQPASPSSLRHPIDTSSNNGDIFEIIDVTWLV